VQEMVYTWAALIIVFLIVEGVTAGLASIWFALGAVAALISVFLGAPVWLQITSFVVVSTVTLIFTRPLARKYVNRRIQPTNADRVIGASAIVTERIDNVASTGYVTVGGRLWPARSRFGDPIEKDTVTVVRSIEGIKLIVEPTLVEEK
jgi:membrane protein implicated in regulation of membrane protease activity